MGHLRLVPSRTPWRNRPIGVREIRGRGRGAKTRTYLMSGIKVSAQMIALIPPIISSSDGASPLGDQIPFKTYRGDVPMVMSARARTMDTSKAHLCQSK